MTGRLVNHNGRVTEKEVEAIKASDLVKLMEVVKAATGLWNAIEANENPDNLWAEVAPAYNQLDAALRALGLIEVQP